MRNLTPYVVSQLDPPAPPQQLAFSEDAVAACILTDGTAAVHFWSPSRGWFGECMWPAESPSVALHFDGTRALAVFANGDFVECNVEDAAADGTAVVVGSLESEIRACAFSPTGELASIVLATEEVLVLSTDFSESAESDAVLGRHQCAPKDLERAHAQVSVGWGRRETQFQGRGARREQRMQDPTTVREEETREPLPGSETAVSVSWRGDGQYFVVNNVIDGERALRIFNSLCELQSVSEPATHLGAAVAWEPRGALIATARPGVIQFFERNGLMRYSFPYETASNDPVAALAWSSNSAVLSVLHMSGTVNLFTVKNWHWYRKQSLQLGRDTSIWWHPEMPCTMAAASSSSGAINFTTWRLAAATHNGLAAVIDANKIMCTPIDRCGVPPPMALAEFVFDAQPIAVAVEHPDRLAVATADNCVHLLRLWHAALEKTGEIGGTRASALTFTSSGELAAFTGDRIRLGEAAEASASFPASSISVLKGDFYLRGSQLCALDATPVHDFGEPCEDFVAAGDHFFFGLTRSMKLLDSRGGNAVVDHGVTSLLATSQHLLYTTLSTLKFVHLQGPPTTALMAAGAVAPTTAAASGSSATNEQVREIERGSLLVTAMPQKMAVVLQAARGNLETIYPRIFVLGEVRSLVAHEEYLAAFRVCRTHRIDMNILYDLNPAQFVLCAARIVASLGTEIDLVLGALRDEDVTKSLYVDTAASATTLAEVPASAEASAAVPNKVNTVLDILAPYLLPQNQVTACCLRQPPAYVDALRVAKTPELIKHLLVLCDADTLYKTALSVYEPKLALVVAQQAQMDPKEYIPFLRARDAENTNRSRFNIDLFLKQYERAVVHLIGDSEATSEEISDFAIRHGLHVLALETLRATGELQQQQQQQHHAQQHADGGRALAERAILQSQAEQWSTAGQHERAGVNFELLGQTEAALESYILGCSWKRAMALVKNGSEQQRAVAERLAEITEIEKRFGDCAQIHILYLQNAPRAVELFCQGQQFDDAVLVAREHGLGGRLDDLLRESFGTFQELLADFTAQVPAQLQRLRKIREKRRQDMLGFEAGIYGDGNGDGEPQVANLALDDTLSIAGSEATTSASVYTRYTDKTGASTGTAATNATRRTLKNQRRQERKKARGKKGSVYEEDYLIASTTRLVARLSDTRADLQSLVAALTRCGLVVYATKLAAEYSKVLAMLREHVDEIYHLDDEARVRFNDSGMEYIAEQPTQPQLPADLD